MLNQDQLDYDQRQYQMMLKLIELFKLDAPSINGLIYDLETLLGCLEEKNDKNWENNFRKECGILEREYSYFIVNKDKEFSVESQELIRGAIDRLKGLVKQKIDP